MDIVYTESSKFYVVTDEEREEVKNYLKNSGKTVGRVGISGTVHEGHKFIIETVKKLYDVVIVDYASWVRLVSSRLFSSFAPPSAVTPPDKVVESLKRNNVSFDYFFCTNITEKISRETSFFRSYESEFRNVLKKLGFTRTSLVTLLWQIIVEEVTGDTEEVGQSFLGPKNILIDLVSKAVVGQNAKYFPNYIWKSYRDPSTFTLESRTSSSILLGKVAREAYSELLRGKTDAKYFANLGSEFYRQEPGFTIIDYKRLEKVDHVTDNCVLVFSEENKFDYIFIKDGMIIS